MKINKLIYLVGSPRSGSTLVYNSLCSSKLFNPSLPENHLIPNFVKYFSQQLKRNTKEKNLIFDSDEDTLNYFRDCINLYFNKISKKHNVNKLALKSILFSSEIDVMNILFPDIKYIMIMRDPRDIITSMLDISTKQITRGIVAQYPRNMKLLSDFINQKYKLLIDKKKIDFIKKAVHVIKYENFISDYKNILNELMIKLNLDYTFSKNHNYWDNSLNLNLSEKNLYKSNLWGKPISNQKIGNYKNILNTDEILEINENCKVLINKYQY